MEKGIFTEQLLKHLEIAGNFVPGIFEAHHAIDIFENLHTIAKVVEERKTTKYIMMCLLPRLKQEEFDSKEQSLIRECTLVKPLLLHFGKYCAPNGCFGRTIACLMFHKNWKIQYTDASEETPECLTHDIVTLQSNIKQFKVTLVNNIKYFTVYVHAEHSASMSRLRRVIVYAMKEVLKKKMKVLQGFKCSICNSTPVHILPLPSMDASLIICEYKPDTKIPLEKSFKVWGQKAEGGM